MKLDKTLNHTFKLSRVRMPFVALGLLLLCCALLSTPDVSRNGLSPFGDEQARRQVGRQVSLCVMWCAHFSLESRAKAPFWDSKDL